MEETNKKSVAFSSRDHFGKSETNCLAVEQLVCILSVRLYNIEQEIFTFIFYCLLFILKNKLKKKTRTLNFINYYLYLKTKGPKSSKSRNFTMTISLYILILHVLYYSSKGVDTA